MCRYSVVKTIPSRGELHLLPIHVFKGMPQVLDQEGIHTMLRLGGCYVMRADFDILPGTDYLIVEEAGLREASQEGA